MNTSFSRLFTSPFFSSVFWGVLGGIILIFATVLTTNGPLQVSAYPFLVLAAIVSIALADKENIKFINLFLTGLFVFLIMTLFLYLYIGIFINPHSGITFLGHLWIWLFVIAIGSASSFILSLIINWLVKQKASYNLKK